MNKFKKFLSVFTVAAFLLSLTPAAWAITTTDKISYGTSTAMTCTGINSLTSSTTVGVNCTAVDNTTNSAVDALVTVKITTGTSTQSDGIYVYVYGSEDGTIYDEEESNSPASAGSYTINSPTNFKGPVFIPVATASKIYQKVFSVAQFFGGTMPRKWGVIVVQHSGQTLAASGNLVQYSEVNYTNS